ncbi:hypothetical protein CACET_c07770 [Clostridium aceticum]|uniref:Uncharacterized protein n=1 Tax=Clostridium aceticum TaxID=84022 RepID=A0A0D8I7T7_9CLOT|nr:hypothetical protein [Clostridium aceticum]AKL94287.1 hypothetical protein CACET_c07770 [Clostridium aceticum]KJF26134.1 hypothetical protein TZ02_14895 [Clostridium aceticum]
MFRFGLILLLIGAIFVYATAMISRVLKITTVKGILMLKVSGLVLAILGAVLLFLNEIPDKLQFLQIIRF